MALGDVTVFDEAMFNMLAGGWESTDDLKMALFTSSATFAAGDTTPTYSDYSANEVTATTEYVAGGLYIGDWGPAVTQTSGTAKFKPTVNPTWSTDASGGLARWGLIYNVSHSSEGICFVDLGANIDMSTTPIIITWNSAGIFDIT